LAGDPSDRGAGPELSRPDDHDGRGCERQKTPNEIALEILLGGFTFIFLFVVVTLEPFAVFSGTSIAMAFLVALFVTLIPTTIGGLLCAVGIAGMDRLVKANDIAKSSSPASFSGPPSPRRAWRSSLHSQRRPGSRAQTSRTGPRCGRARATRSWLMSE
jgi:hypothetical protein